MSDTKGLASFFGVRLFFPGSSQAFIPLLSNSIVCLAVPSFCWS
jgi:hypothetical protein